MTNLILVTTDKEFGAVPNMDKVRYLKGCKCKHCNQSRLQWHVKRKNRSDFWPDHFSENDDGYDPILTEEDAFKANATNKGSLHKMCWSI